MIVPVRISFVRQINRLEKYSKLTDIHVLYTHNHNKIDNNGTTNTYSNTGAIQRQAKQTDSVVQVRTILLTSCLDSSTQGERHKERDTILTMLTILSDPINAQCILWCLRSP